MAELPALTATKSPPTDRSAHRQFSGRPGRRRMAPTRRPRRSLHRQREEGCPGGDLWTECGVLHQLKRSEAPTDEEDEDRNATPSHDREVHRHPSDVPHRQDAERRRLHDACERERWEPGRQVEPARGITGFTQVAPTNPSGTAAAAMANHNRFVKPPT